MSNANRPNRKASDADIIRLNSLGHSLGYIAKELNVHPTTITLRLDNLGIKPADTRRTFMESILENLTPAQTEILVSQLGPHLSIKDYVQNLLVKECIAKAA
jgi:hypothetical protein